MFANRTLAAILARDIRAGLPALGAFGSSPNDVGVGLTILIHARDLAFDGRVIRLTIRRGALGDDAPGRDIMHLFRYRPELLRRRSLVAALALGRFCLCHIDASCS